MTIVMTMLVPDDEELVDAQLRFHLNTGVDLLIVGDRGSAGATTELLHAYERHGRVRLLEAAAGDGRESEWRTRAARLAATDHGADWVIATDADEFWWPRGPSLDEVLANIPPQFGIVHGIARHFVPVPEPTGPFFERMVYRLAPKAPIADPASPWQPYRKAAHRASATVTVSADGRTVTDSSLRPLRGWYPIEVLHFPLRSGTTDTAPALEQGVLTPDERLRDVLRTVGPVPALPRSGLKLPAPTVVDDALFAIDVTTLGEADVSDARQALDQIERRLRAVESAPAVRLERALRSLARRARHRRAPSGGEP